MNRIPLLSGGELPHLRVFVDTDNDGQIYRRKYVSTPISEYAANRNFAYCFYGDGTGDTTLSRGIMYRRAGIAPITKFAGLTTGTTITTPEGNHKGHDGFIRFFENLTELHPYVAHSYPQHAGSKTGGGITFDEKKSVGVWCFGHLPSTFTSLAPYTITDPKAAELTGHEYWSVDPTLLSNAKKYKISGRLFYFFGGYKPGAGASRIGAETTNPVLEEGSLFFSDPVSGKQFRIEAHLCVQKTGDTNLYTYHWQPIQRVVNISGQYGAIDFVIGDDENSWGTELTNTGITLGGGGNCTGVQLRLTVSTVTDTGVGAMPNPSTFDANLTVGLLGAAFQEFDDWSQVYDIGTARLSTPVRATTRDIRITDGVSQDITSKVLGLNWSLGVTSKVTIAGNDTEAIITIRNQGEYTPKVDGSEDKILPGMPIQICVENDTFDYNQPLWTGYVEQFLPVVGDPNEQVAEIRATTGLYLFNENRTVQSVDNIPTVDDGTSTLSPDGKISLNPAYQYLLDTLATICERSSWRPGATIPGFRLNEGKLGNSSHLLNLFEYIDANDLRYFYGTLLYANDLFMKGGQFAEGIKRFANSGWAHTLVDRYGRLVFRSNLAFANQSGLNHTWTGSNYPAPIGLPAIGLDNVQSVRMTLGESVYNLIQVEYTGAEIQVADLVPTETYALANDEEGSDNEKISNDYGRKGNVSPDEVRKLKKTIKELMVWRGRNKIPHKTWEDRNYFPKIFPKNETVRVTVLPYDKERHVLLEIFNPHFGVAEGSLTAYHRASSVLYKREAGGTEADWTLAAYNDLTLGRIARPHKPRRRWWSMDKNDNVLTIAFTGFGGTNKDLWFRRLTGAFLLIDEDTSLAEYVTESTLYPLYPTSPIVRAFLVSPVFWSNADQASKLAESIALDLAPAPELQQLQFTVRDETTLNLARNIGIGQHVIINMPEIGLPHNDTTTNVHVVISEDHQIQGNQWTVTYGLRLLKDPTGCQYDTSIL